MNEIYIKTIGESIFELNDLQIKDLEQIVWQCPFDGGPAVYMARSLYALVDNSIYFDDDAICSSKDISARLAGRDVPNEFKIYPNPTTGQATVLYNIPENDKAVFYIYDLLGNLAFQQAIDYKLTSATFKLDFLKPGIYKCCISDNEKMYYQDKIAIIR